MGVLLPPYISLLQEGWWALQAPRALQAHLRGPTEQEQEKEQEQQEYIGLLILLNFWNHRGSFLV